MPIPNEYTRAEVSYLRTEVEEAKERIEVGSREDPDIVTEVPTYQMRALWRGSGVEGEGGGKVGWEVKGDVLGPGRVAQPDL